jgi:SAGA-associated factor 29
MSARSRPRANHNQDADEERRLWKEIKDKAHEVDSMIARSNEIGSPARRK